MSCICCHYRVLVGEVGAGDDWLPAGGRCLPGKCCGASTVWLCNPSRSRRLGILFCICDLECVRARVCAYACMRACACACVRACACACACVCERDGCFVLKTINGLRHTLTGKINVVFIKVIVTQHSRNNK